MATMAGVLTAGRKETVTREAEAGGHRGTAKNVLLFFAAPFVGLAYIILFPFVGWYALARVAVLRR